MREARHDELYTSAQGLTMQRESVHGSIGTPWVLRNADRVVIDTDPYRLNIAKTHNLKLVELGAESPFQQPPLRPRDIVTLAGSPLRGEVYEAWVNYGRQTFPLEPSHFMLAYEEHWGARLPFEMGDRWLFDHALNSWVIVKMNGEQIVTARPKPVDRSV